MRCCSSHAGSKWAYLLAYQHMKSWGLLYISVVSLWDTAAWVVFCLSLFSRFPFAGSLVCRKLGRVSRVRFTVGDPCRACCGMEPSSALGCCDVVGLGLLLAPFWAGLLPVWQCVIHRQGQGTGSESSAGVHVTALLRSTGVSMYGCWGSGSSFKLSLLAATSANSAAVGTQPGVTCRCLFGGGH